MRNGEEPSTMFGKKPKLLPKHFQQLLVEGDLAALQQVYKKCDINATNGKGGCNAFEMTPLPREFAVWLKEQGGNVNHVSTLGRTPIFRHASAPDGDVELLIQLGAQVDPGTSGDGTTPLHLAAAAGQLDAMAILLEHGAYPLAKRNDLVLGAWGITPLELAICQAKLSFHAMCDVSELLLAHGGQLTPRTRQAVGELEERFHLEKANIDDVDVLAQQEEGLERLKKLILSPTQP